MEDWKSKLHRRVLNLRNIEGLINTDLFNSLWENSGKRQREEVVEIIEKEDKDRLLFWMRNHPSIELSEKPLSTLRRTAARIGVTNYSRLSKGGLIREISRKEKEYGVK